MNQQHPKWQIDYAQWIGGLPINQKNGNPFMGTGTSTAPAGMHGSQHYGQPKQLNNQNALMQSQPADPGYGLGSGQMPQHLNGGDDDFEQFVMRILAGGR